ncbi:hypothetical protein F5Y05DRAFT_417528 [Hypoxylon sp. FL0543]|nr:hypothetical protein F5Y05DRAFT_417528 [Hypoxylon sp. FL0543]
MALSMVRVPFKITIVRALNGDLLLAEVDEKYPPKLQVNETIQLHSVLDDPSYFSDPYATKTGRDANGYALAGLEAADERQATPAFRLFKRWGWSLSHSTLRFQHLWHAAGCTSLCCQRERLRHSDAGVAVAIVAIR